MKPSTLSLIDANGRKYINQDERAAFLNAASEVDGHIRTLAETLTYTGCRISEALAITVSNVDIQSREIHFLTLKRRKSGVWRSVPVPRILVEHLDLAYSIRRLLARRQTAECNNRLWPISRVTAWRAISGLMEDAGIHGPQASPKGLRHGFGVAAVEAGVPLNLIQRWLGHASLETTSIYTQVIGAEEKALADRIFSDIV